MTLGRPEDWRILTGARRPHSGVPHLLVACVFFAIMATSVGAAHRYDSELTAAMSTVWRSAVNLILLVFLVRGRVRVLMGDRRLALMVRGVFGALSLLCYFAALARIGVGESAFLNQTSGIWVAVLAPVVLGERTRPLVWVAVVVSFVGMAMLTQPRGDVNDGLGRILGLVSGIGAGAAYLAVRRASTTNPAEAIIAWFAAISTIMGVAWLGVAGGPWSVAPQAGALLLLSGVAATGGQLFMTHAYRLGPAAPVAAAGVTGPVLATLMGWLVLGQTVDGLAIMGMWVLVISGVALPLFSVREGGSTSSHPGTNGVENEAV